MDDKKRITLTNMCKHEISLSFPEFHFVRTLPKKGATVKIDRETFLEMVYDPGLSYMLQSGMIFLDDMEIKKDIGLEPEDAEEPKNIKMLSDKDFERYLKILPITELKSVLKSLKKEQIDSLIDYAIEHEIVDMTRCDILKQMTGRDIVRAIQLNREAKEELPQIEE